MSILLLIVTIYPIATGSTTTQSPLLSGRSSRPASDYILVTWPHKQMNWISAETYCHVIYDSNLATILTDKQYHQISNYSSSPAMIGLKQTSSNHNWSWINTPNTDALSYCSQIIINSRQYHIQPIDCNTPHNQFYCNKVQSYIYIPEPKTFFDAEEYCKKQYGTHLATISHSKHLHNVVRLSNNTVWIGLYKNNNDNIWLDTTPYIEKYMKTFITLDGTSHCTTLNGYKQRIGNNHNCDISLPFICNKRSKPREYMLYKQRTTYIEAQRFCVETLDTDLATVITEEEFSDVMRLIPESKGAWIGLKKQYIDGIWQWKWIDGTICTEHSVCIPYWLQNDVITEPIYECGWLWQNGRARTGMCTMEMEYVLCNKPSEGDVIWSGNEIVVVSDVVHKDVKEYTAHKKQHAILSEKALHHGKVLYYVYPDVPYDATYIIPANWVVVIGYIAIGAIVLSAVLCCVLYCLFLTEPIPIEIDNKDIDQTFV